MTLRSLRLRNMRAHSNSTIDLSSGVNLLYGCNGAGKTNILEAIHYLCLTKSFLTGVERYVIQRGQDYFEVEGQFEGTVRKKVTIRTAVSLREGKRIFLNGVAPERKADIVGIVPIVVFVPGDQSLTYGGPDDRRKFLNGILSQASPNHLRDLIRYRRALKQRNEVLSHRHQVPIDPSLIAPLNAILAQLGSRIIVQRSGFIAEFNDKLKQAWKQLGQAIEEPSIVYQGPIHAEDYSSADDAESVLLSALVESTPRDIDKGRTNTGPHRDELVFKLDDQEVRRFGSTGQHRSFAIALRIAQFNYLDDRLEEKPILLLDDVFDSLDPTRTEVILEWLRGDSTGQSLLTAADSEKLRSRIKNWGHPHQSIHVQSGQVMEHPPEEE